MPTEKQSHTPTLSRERQLLADIMRLVDVQQDAHKITASLDFDKSVPVVGAFIKEIRDSDRRWIKALSEALRELLGSVTAQAAPDTTQPIMWSASPCQGRRMYAARCIARDVLAKLDASLFLPPGVGEFTVPGIGNRASNPIRPKSL